MIRGNEIDKIWDSSFLLDCISTNLLLSVKTHLIFTETHKVKLFSILSLNSDHAEAFKRLQLSVSNNQMR